MELTKKQEDLLIEISKEKDESVRMVGRKIYSTDVSCYNVRDLFLANNLISLTKHKNKEIPKLTNKGKIILKEIWENRLLGNK
jgi:hypothetical protein